MGYTISTVFLVCMLFTIATGSASAVIYDFAAGMDDWTAVSGKWSVDDGELVQTDTATPAMKALVGEQDWSDYTIKCRIMITNGSYTGVVFRAVSDLEYYVFYMNANENVVELWQHTTPAADSRTNHFKHAPAGGIVITSNEWFDFEIVVEGTSAQFYVNDELQGEFNGLVHENGKVGAWTWATEVHFDDFSISGPGIPEAAVEPGGKLALTWGDVKTE